MDNELKELLIYMTVSAAGLKDEPANYGGMRLIHGAQRLAQILQASDLPGTDKEVLGSLTELIEAHKNDHISDEHAWQKMLQDAVELLVELN